VRASSFRGDNGAEQHPVQTDSRGRFMIPNLPADAYTICTSLSGFVRRCVPVTVPTHSVMIEDPVALRPEGKVVRGCVKLKDGSPGIRVARSSQQSSGRAVVTAVGPAGQVVAGPLPVNLAGCYVLPVPETDGLSIVANYEQASAKASLAPSATLRAVTPLDDLRA
jgi:hypothetical protein